MVFSFLSFGSQCINLSDDPGDAVLETYILGAIMRQVFTYYARRNFRASPDNVLVKICGKCIKLFKWFFSRKFYLDNLA